MSQIKTIKLIDKNGVVFGVVQTAGVIHQIVDSSALPSDAAKESKQLVAGHTITVINLATLATVAKQLPDGHNVAVSNMIPTVETGLATSLKQLANSHDVQIKGYTGASQQYPRLDPATFNFKTILNDHAKIHESASYHTYVNASGGSGTKATVSFTTPNTTTWIHLLIIARANVESFLTLGEGATITASSGVNFTPYNRQRNSVNTSVLISAGSAGGAGNVTTGGAVTNFGTTLQLEHLGNNKMGEESRGTSEWILKQNTTYAIELETEAASSEAFISLEWYETVHLE